MILALVVSVTACRREHGTAITYLADLGSAPGRPLAVAEIGGEQRPVLFRSEETFTIAAGKDTIPPSLVLEVPVVTPSTAELSVKPIARVGQRLVPVEVHVGESTASLSFQPSEAGSRVQYTLVATRFAPAGARRHTVGPVHIPARSRLRVGMGFESCAAHPLTDFRIDVVTGRRARPVLRRRLDPSVTCGRWADAEVPLPPAEDGTVSFRFRVRASRAADRAQRLYALWADPIIISPRSNGPPPPNVVLVSLDTLGAKHVGACGYPYPTSPHLDALAADGTLFTRAVSHYPLTPASHMTLFTSLLPAAHGVRTWFDQLPDHVPTLPEVLRRAGYMTAAVTEDAALAKSMGFGRGFHVYWEDTTKPAVTTGIGRRTFRRALSWLRSAPPEPFFLFIHTYEVHEPYVAPRRYLSLVRPGADADAGGDKVSGYDAKVRLLDRLLGRFLAGVAQAGIRDRSLLIVISDHGEAFGEHASWVHGTMLYDEVMHVPLVLRGPGVPRGLRIAAPVGLVDVLPTVLELTGTAAPPGIHGRSLVPALRGEALPPRALIAEVRGRLGNPAPPPDLRAVWLTDRKAIYDAVAERWQVFDLRDDPREERPLSDASDTVEEARRVLSWYDALGAARPNGASDVTTSPPSPESREKLRALGYVE